MILKKIRENLFLTVVVLIYAVLLVVKPTMGLESLNNSAYYLKEMLVIMPVIFILTALLDTWIPKEKIIQYLGKDSRAKGIFLSFVIGSISAGPIYAAFPMCVMLHKKGASIKNLIIILSSWAATKVPMLLNEAKFLGVKFMIIRWILTVLAIIIFSWIADKIIKNEDLPNPEIAVSGLTVNKSSCIGCGICAREYPEMFEMKNKKAIVKFYEEGSLEKDKIDEAIKVCPVGSIKYND